MMRGKDLEESQKSVGKEDGTRDPHPSHKKQITTSRTMNTLTCSLESCATSWDNGHKSPRNLLPCLQMRNTKISACG